MRKLAKAIFRFRKGSGIEPVLGTCTRKVFCILETYIEIVFGPVECCVPRIVQSQALVMWACLQVFKCKL